MPFIRYATGDCGTLLDADNLNRALENNSRKDLHINLPLPILAVTGRTSNQVVGNGITITAEDVKQMLYGNSEIARNITGDFRLSFAGPNFKIEVQLMKGAENSGVQGLIKKAAESLGKSVLIETYEYNKFPYNVALDYESKWAYTNLNKI
jgi:phenylacetate-coenzyme A ligase PaaK-like adenylate-forming protein